MIARWLEKLPRGLSLDVECRGRDGELSGRSAWWDHDLSLLTLLYDKHLGGGCQPAAPDLAPAAPATTRSRGSTVSGRSMHARSARPIMKGQSHNPMEVVANYVYELEGRYRGDKEEKPQGVFVPKNYLT